jgi:hypothetical protein
MSALYVAGGFLIASGILELAHGGLPPWSLAIAAGMAFVIAGAAVEHNGRGYN